MKDQQQILQDNSSRKNTQGGEASEAFQMGVQDAAFDHMAGDDD